MSVENIVNTVTHKVRVLNKLEQKLERKLDEMESLVDSILISKSDPIVIQELSSQSVKLDLLTSDMNYVYGTQNNQELFNFDIITESHNTMYLQISASFIVESDNLDMGSVMLRLKINNGLVTENETILSNIGYNNVSLNFVHKIEEDAIYNIEISFEGNIITNNLLTDDVYLHVKDNGASLSVMVI